MSKKEVVKTDSTILDVMSLLEKKIASFKEIEESIYHISGNFDFGGAQINIQTETDIAKLIKVGAKITELEAAYIDYAENVLELRSYPVFNLNGHSATHVNEDIKLRIKVLQTKEELDQLKSLRDEAKSFMSVEDQKQMFMDKLAKFVK